jgi:hypothetical protein
MRRLEHGVPAQTTHAVHPVIARVDHRADSECLATQGQSEKDENGILPHSQRSTQQAFIVSEFLKKPSSKVNFSRLLLVSQKTLPAGYLRLL